MLLRKGECGMQLLETTDQIESLWATEGSRINAREHPAEMPRLPSHPAGRYFDPDFYELERRHMFDRVWLLAAIASELPGSGSFKATELNGRPIFLVKGGDGRIRAFHNACQHRGACLVRQEAGTAKSFACPYHAWNYGLEGQLKFVPDEYDFPGLNRAAKGLRPLRCESHGNLVFVSFNEAVMPLGEYLGGLVDMLSDVPWDQVRLYQTCDFEAACNWKCVHDAFSETYHVQFTHRDTVHQAINRTYTARQMLRNGHNAMVVRNRTSEDGTARQNVLDAGPASSQQVGVELSELTRTAQRSYNLFPNITIPVGENLTTILTAWPIALDRTRIRLRYLKIDPAADMDTSVDRATVEGFNAVLQEDLYALDGIQQALSGGGLSSITLGAGERFIYNFHRELDRVIGKENIPEHLRVEDIELPLVD
jgi:phenylpropionate dioxygenase-like ring-hydroxylating dioxygenase large terminal subunit